MSFDLKIFGMFRTPAVRDRPGQRLPLLLPPWWPGAGDPWPWKNWQKFGGNHQFPIFVFPMEIDIYEEYIYIYDKYMCMYIYIYIHDIYIYIYDIYICQIYIYIYLNIRIFPMKIDMCFPMFRSMNVGKIGWLEHVPCFTIWNWHQWDVHTIHNTVM